MAVTDITSGRVIRSYSPDQVDRHAFTSVAELPELEVARPGPSGNPALDALRSVAWDEGFAEGRAAGVDDGYGDGFEQGLAAGREAGYRDGLASAEQDAVAMVQARFASATQSLETAVRKLDEHDRLVLAQMEDAIVELGLGVARAILDREIATAGEPGRDALARALALAPDHTSYLARLNPADFDSIGEVADLAPGRQIELASDPSVEPGGCVIEAGAARIDAQIDTALARVREVLLP